MNWWQRWKAKHWDWQVIEREPGERIFSVGVYPPPLRRFSLWFAKLWREQPLNCVMTVMAVIGAVAAIIGLFR